MNEDDKKVLEKLASLYSNPGWDDFLDELEIWMEEAKGNMLNAQSWEQFLEERGKMNAFNFLLNVREITKEMLDEEDS